MTINSQSFNVIQYTAEEAYALALVHNLMGRIVDFYPSGAVLESPNDGEVVEVDELLRVRGILDFFFRNRVVEVKP